MKKLMILLVIAVAVILSGCDDTMSLRKQDDVAAVEICKNNGDYVQYSLRKGYLNYVKHEMIVTCNDGAVFTLVMVPIKDGDEWKDFSKYSWEVVK